MILRTTTGAEPAPLDEVALGMVDPKDVQYRITILEEEMGVMEVDLEAIAKWRAADAEYSNRARELEAATAERDEVGFRGGGPGRQKVATSGCLLIRPAGAWPFFVQVRREHEELRKRRLDEFMAGFNVIGLKLKEMYQMITLGGDAELELVDSLDPFAGSLGVLRQGEDGGALLLLLMARATYKLLVSQHSALKNYLALPDAAFSQRAFYSACGPRRRAGRTLPTCRAARRRCPRSPLSLRCTTSSPLHFTSWMRSMLRWVRGFARGQDFLLGEEQHSIAAPPCLV